jgi:hypothetical protein
MSDGLKPCQFRQVDPQGRILCQLVKGGDRQVSADLCRACPVQSINCQHLRAGLEKQLSTPITVRFATGRVEVWNDAPAAMSFKQAACAAKTIPIYSLRDCTGCPLRAPNLIPQNVVPAAARAKPNAPTALPIAAPTVTTTAPTAQPRAKRAAQTAQTKRAAPTVQSALAQNNTAQETLSPAAADMLARAKATAQKKAQEQAAIAQAAQRVAAEERAPYAPEPKSKIIQIQQWLAGQMTRKQAAQPLPVTPDADGVSEIVYAPLGGQTAQAYQETIDYERCVGWTD